MFPALEGKTEATVICFSFSPSSSIFIRVTRDRITLTAVKFIKRGVGRFGHLPALFVINEEPYPCAKGTAKLRACAQFQHGAWKSSDLALLETGSCVWHQRCLVLLTLLF